MSDPKFPTQKSVTAIILAGGESNRFQIKNAPWQDKALMTIGNETLLTKTVKTVSQICREIIVITKNRDRKRAYQKQLLEIGDEFSTKIRVEVDNTRFFCFGPTRGILSALQLLHTTRAIIVPVDMPHLREEFLQEILNNLALHPLVVPFWPSTGKISPLVLAINADKIDLATTTILSRIRRGRADDLHRAVGACKFLAISPTKERISNNIFSSINSRANYKELASRKLPETIDSLFAPNDSLVTTSPHKRKPLEELSDFLKRTVFLYPSQEIIEEAFALLEKLSENKLHFYSGLLSSTIANLIPLHSNNEEKTCHSFLDNCSFMPKIAKKGIAAYITEAKNWKKLGISFLELHAYSDALVLAQKIHWNNKLAPLEEKIEALKTRMALTNKRHKKYDFRKMIDNHLPGFLSKAQKRIQEAEAKFNEESPKLETNFLWEHSFRVGRIAYKIALQEGAPPLIPTLAAILHDAGKFVLGSYHTNKKPEEEHSASIAKDLLSEENFPKKDIGKVLKAITALYNEQLPCDINCQIVHDADRLDKLGVLGVANFFTKSTLRGVNLRKAILTNLSRELTYAFMAPETMLTKTGRRLAQTRGEETINFFEKLLAELKNFDIGHYYIKRLEIETGKILLVVPAHCHNCKGQFLVHLSKKQGLKCEKIQSKYLCNNCGVEYLVVFCLPIISERK